MASGQHSRHRTGSVSVQAGQARGRAGHAGARTPGRRHRAAREASWRAHGRTAPGRRAGRWRRSYPRVT